jgi:hypothetical protein
LVFHTVASPLYQLDIPTDWSSGACIHMQVGHSMGGAVAALLAMMLRCSIPDVRCFAYGPPACACAALSKATEGYIHSMVYCHDVIPRVSIQNVAALVEELSQCDEWQRTVGGDARALLHRYFVELGAPRVRRRQGKLTAVETETEAEGVDVEAKLPEAAAAAANDDGGGGATPRKRKVAEATEAAAVSGDHPQGIEGLFQGGSVGGRAVALADAGSSGHGGSASAHWQDEAAASNNPSPAGSGSRSKVVVKLKAKAGAEEAVSLQVRRPSLCAFWLGGAGVR